MSNKIQVVPLTDDEITEIQLTVASRIMELHQESSQGKISEADASAEIAKLSNVMRKCSQYQTPKPLTL